MEEGDSQDLLSQCVSELENIKKRRETLDRKFQLFLERRKMDPQFAIKSPWKKQIFSLEAKFLDNLLLLEYIKFTDIQNSIFGREVDPSSKPISLEELISENNYILQEMESIKNRNNPKVEIVPETNELRKLRECAQELHYVPIPEIEDIIRDTTTVINKQLTEWINNFKDSKTDENVRDVIVRVNENICAIYPALVANIDVTKIELCIENFVFPFIHSTIMENLEMREQDENLAKRSSQFSSATQEEFNINPKLIDKSYIPYYPAISLLRTVNFSLTPSRKLYTIIQAAKEVFNITGRLLPGESIGGDDFTDIWVYVVTKAQIPNLWSTITFIRDYGNEELLQAELGYYFTTTHLAASYISKLSREKLKSSKKSLISSNPFVVFEKAKYERFCDKFPHIKIVAHNVIFTGYRLYVHSDLFQNPGRFFCTFLRKSNNKKDTVIGHVLQAKSSINPIQLEFLYNTFFQDYPVLGFVCTETPHGMAFLFNKGAIKHSHMHIRSGDFDRELEQTKAMVNFRNLKYELKLSTPPFLDYESLDAFYSTYSIDLDVGVTNAVNTIVKRVQTALIHLNFLHKLCEKDGLLSEIVTASLKNFQEFYNTSTRQNLSEGESLDMSRFLSNKNLLERPMILESNGLLNINTYTSLFCLLSDYVDGLSEVIEIPFTADPIEDCDELSKTIGEFQTKNNMIPNFVFDQKTISAIIALLVKKKKICE